MSLSNHVVEIFQNEMNAFRYDVILHINKQSPAKVRKKKYRDWCWKSNNLSLKKLENELNNGPFDGLRIQNILNSRVQRGALLKDCRKLPTEKSTLALPWINSYLQYQSMHAIDPRYFSI